MITLQDILKIYNKVQTPVQEQLVQFNIDNVVDLWREKYNKIKDESWPECNTMESFYNLPEHIQKECHDIHQFSPSIWKQKIYDDAVIEFKFPPSTIQQRIIKDNLDYIINKDIVDFACNTGGYGFAAINVGANSVVGFDIRDDNLKLAEAIKIFYNIADDKLKFLKLDIHDYNKITNLCQNKHTALVPGIMYHVYDHYQILLSIAKANVDTIIIETAEADSITNSIEPLVWWRVENTFERIAGWSENFKKIPVGYPNESWFKMILNELQYECLGKTQHRMSTSKHNSDEFTHGRTVYVFQKIKL
jgi:SAM-dependent methyltransferase